MIDKALGRLRQGDEKRASQFEAVERSSVNRQPYQCAGAKIVLHGAKRDAGDARAVTDQFAHHAEVLHLHPKRVQALARSGRLPALRVGRKWLFDRDALDRTLGRMASPVAPTTGTPTFTLSARNRLRGIVRHVRTDGLMAEVVLAIGDQELVSVVTRSSVERLGIREGVEAFAVIKATEVMLGMQTDRA